MKLLLMIYIYILLLEESKYYIGKTNNTNLRFLDHYNNNGSEWTKLYKPISNNCAIVEKMNPDPSFTTTTYYSNTGLLFTNSLVLTKKGIYKFLSEGTRRPNG